jgi:hypothetical protein
MRDIGFQSPNWGVAPPGYFDEEIEATIELTITFDPERTYIDVSIDNTDNLVLKGNRTERLASFIEELLQEQKDEDEMDAAASRLEDSLY